MPQLNIRISDELLDRARLTADLYHTTVTQLIIDSLTRECYERSARMPRGSLAQPVIVGSIDIPCPHDRVIAVSGRANGTAAGCVVIDVRNVHDVTTIPISAYRANVRIVQLICSAEQYDVLMTHVKGSFDPISL